LSARQLRLHCIHKIHALVTHNPCDHVTASVCQHSPSYAFTTRVQCSNPSLAQTTAFICTLESRPAVSYNHIQYTSNRNNRPTHLCGNLPIYPLLQSSALSRTSRLFLDNFFSTTPLSKKNSKKGSNVVGSRISSEQERMRKKATRKLGQHVNSGGMRKNLGYAALVP
jgi:hypothetical protein